MEGGCGADEAFCFASINKNAGSTDGKDLIGDGGLEGLVGSGRHGGAACRDGHVGTAEEPCLEMGDGEKTLASTQRDFVNVGCGASTASGMDMHTETCAHIPFSSQTHCKLYSNNLDSKASCEVGFEEAIDSHSEAGAMVCAASYPHCLSSSPSECECAASCTHCFCGSPSECKTPYYMSLHKMICLSERTFCKQTEGFCEVGKAEEACNRGKRVLGEVSDGEFVGWMSPRISFSRDFAMVDLDTAVCNNTQNISSRLSPEKRKWDQQDDDGSTDFEFLRYMPSQEGVKDSAFMLSADELFSNGKLLPVPFCNRNASRDDFYLPSTSEQHHSQSTKLSIHKCSARRPMTRHLSFELSRPHCTMSHVVTSCKSSPSRVLEGDSSSCAAPGLHVSMPTSASKLSSPMPSSVSLTTLLSPSPKYSAKFKEIFKLKKVSADPLPSELSRDNGFISTCRLPISPRSFWPFARSSSSICDTKSSTACRGILETDAASLNSISLENVDTGEGAKTCSNTVNELSKIEGLTASISEKTSTLLGVTSTGEASNTENLIESQAHSHPSLNNVPDTRRERNVSMVASKVRESLSPSEGLMRKTSATSGFARGSPGRRGGTKKLNTGKIVLRNLERCSAEKRLGRDEWKGASRRSPFCAATRVSPVLNVAIYRGGKASKNGFFSFGSLFSYRKKKPLEATPINWRKGA